MSPLRCSDVPVGNAVERGFAGDHHTLLTQLAQPMSGLDVHCQQPRKAWAPRAAMGSKVVSE